MPLYLAIESVQFLREKIYTIVCISSFSTSTMQNLDFELRLKGNELIKYFTHCDQWFDNLN